MIEREIEAKRDKAISESLLRPFFQSPAAMLAARLLLSRRETQQLLSDMSSAKFHSILTTVLTTTARNKGVLQHISLERTLVYQAEQGRTETARNGQSRI